MFEPPFNLSDRYQVVRRLGSGAFATVYLADDLRMGRPVAIKVVEHTADVDDRVLREAQAAAKLNHHHIVTMYEMVRESDRTYLFTEYVEGRTLREHFRDQSLSDRDIIEVGIQLCQALEHAHKRGVVHRDIKPENIMLAGGGAVDVRLMDFGVAQLSDRASITMDGDLVGTLAYMSPEQIEGTHVDSRSDVYSLALTLYEGLTRKNPQKGKKLQELLCDVSRPTIPPLSDNRPDLPLEVSDAIGRAMVLDRYSRPDAAGLGRLLTQLRRLVADSASQGTSQAADEGTLATRVMRRLAPMVSPTPVDSDRLVFLGRHVTAGALSLLTLLYLLPRMPFYPEVAIAPLVIAIPFVALLWPLGGAVLSLAVAAPPIFAYAPGWGFIYLFVAVVTLIVFRWRRLEWAALLPGAIPFAVTWGLGLVLLPLTGALLRRWGPWMGFLSGLVLTVAGGLGMWSVLPFTFNPAPGAPLAAAADSVSPWTVLLELARLLDARPELALQTFLFTLFALPFYAWGGGSKQARMWGATAYLSLLIAGFVLVPILALDVPVVVLPFLAAYVPCAIIGFLSALLLSSQGEGTLQEA